MYGDLVRDSLSLCVLTLSVVLGSSRGWGFAVLVQCYVCAMTCQRACVVERLPPDTSQG